MCGSLTHLSPSPLSISHNISLLIDGDTAVELSPSEIHAEATINGIRGARQPDTCLASQSGGRRMNLG